MKKIMLVIIVAILMTSCANKDNIDSTELYQLQLEEDDYIWVTATIEKGLFDEVKVTGYIEQITLDEYINNELSENYRLKVIHPYEEGAFVVVNISDIEVLSIR